MSSKYAFKLFCKNSNSLYLLLAYIFLLSACAENLHPSTPNPVTSYKTDDLAKDWREQVRKNKANPYEGYNYPSDNDSDYFYPNKKNSLKTHTKAPQRPSSQQNNKYKNLPLNDESDDSSYGKFPRYNPDDDNVYIDSKSYPLYLE